MTEKKTDTKPKSDGEDQALQGTGEVKESPKEYKILLNNQEGTGGDKAVPVTIGGDKYPAGKTWNIPREVETWVPEEVFRVLERAVPTRYRVQEEGKELVLLSKKTRRFALSVLETRPAKTGGR